MAVVVPPRGIPEYTYDQSRHEHLPLGSGDVDLSAAVAALAAVGYRGGLHVELPRQSHRWLETARQSAAVLAPLISQESPA